jgi:hypothetical protein
MAFPGFTGTSGTGLFGLGNTGNASQQPAGNLFISVLPTKGVEIV